MDWTTEQILGVAPDQFTLRASQGIAKQTKWVALHQDGQTLWGIFPNGKRKDGQTAVFLPSSSVTCSCNSRKFPCRHQLALLQIWQQQNSLFTPMPLETQLAIWATREQQRHSRTADEAKQSLPKQPPPQQMAQLKTGLHELELWLTDMVRHGLATLPERPKTYWVTMANRLIDAQAPTLAQQVQQMGKIPTAQPNWPQETLKQVGRLYLIIQGFRQFNQLSSETQADLQTAVGWLPTPHPNRPNQADNWLVLGRTQEQVGKKLHTHSWLWGEKCRKIAQLTQISRPAKPKGICHITGTVLQGSLQFSPSNWPLRATQQGGLQQYQRSFMPQGFNTIQQATQMVSHALAANPWQNQFPMLLHNIMPVQQESKWQLTDQEGSRLPLPDKFPKNWHLTALAGGTPALTLFGLWNGRFLQPLTVFTQNCWQDVQIWRGIR
jgi:hypothetical protein